MTPGRFITLEGGEGGGKSTQIRLLSEWLQRQGLAVLLTRQPGGTPAAEAIRPLLLAGDTYHWQPMTEALLHNAARHEHVQQAIRPALAAGQWVLCDRYADSTRAYQGFGHGVPMTDLDALQGMATGGLMPDLTLILDLPPEIGLARTVDRTSNEDRYERMDIAFHYRLRQGFLSIAADQPQRCVVIDAARAAATVQAQLQSIVAARFGLLPA